MPQEFQVLQCYQCKVFQVHQVKKAKKWACKMCGEKQSIKKVHVIGTGADCRKVVQDLNMRRGQILESCNEENEQYNDGNEQTCQQSSHSVENEIEIQENLQKENKWEKYTECSDDNEDNEENQIEEDNVYCNYTWQRQPTGRKRKRNEDETKARNEQFAFSERKPVHNTNNRMLTGQSTEVTDTEFNNKFKGHTGQGLYQVKPQSSGFDSKYFKQTENLSLPQLENESKFRSGCDTTHHKSVHKKQSAYGKNVSNQSLSMTSSCESKWGQFCDTSVDIGDILNDEDPDCEVNLHCIQQSSSSLIKTQVLETANTNDCNASKTTSYNAQKTKFSSVVSSSTRGGNGGIGVETLSSKPSTSSKWGRFMDEEVCEEDNDSDSDSY